MGSISNYIILSTALLFLTVQGTTAQTMAGGSKQNYATTIEQQIAKKLVRLPHYGVFDHITFKVEGDTVLLDGKVNSLGTRGQAESAVKRVAGVARVINNIDELPPSTADDEIRRRALQTFSDRGLYRYFWELNPDVRIIVEQGRVTLEGRVSNRGDYNTLNILANGISGVFSVDNNLAIGRGDS